MKRLIFIVLLVLSVLNVTVFASDEKNAKSSWETAVYLDNFEMITRVYLDNDNETAIALRDLSETLGYSVEWVEKEQCIIMKKNHEKINIYVNKNLCEKNGEEITLNKPVFIIDGQAYLPQSFLINILDIDTILIDQEVDSNRVNGLFLADVNGLKNDLIVVNSNAFVLEAKPYDAMDNGETLLFSFALGIERQDIAISMDYEKFLKSNEAKVAKIVKEELEKTNGDGLKNTENMNAFKIKIVDNINQSLNINFVKYIYITEFTWRNSL